MKAVILNGSPKGEESITLHTCLYIKAKNPDIDFSILNVGQRIKHYEKDMSEAICALKEADLIIFSYPVYTFIAPYQLQRFIELLKECEVDLRGKCATQISTSKHFYDVTAHRYIEDNCADMGINFIKGLSADMDDLLAEKGQKEAEQFFKYVLFCYNEKIFETPSVLSSSETCSYESTFSPTEKRDGFDTVIVADIKPDDNNLLNMIEDFRAVYPFPTRLFNIEEFPFMGGCLGCFNCAGTGKCVYPDNFDCTLREKIQNASSIVYAFTIKDHSMGSRFKLFDDRQFCNGHRTVTIGMPIGYIVNGDISKEENLSTILEARSEVGHNFLCGVGDNSTNISHMAKRMEYALMHKFIKPQNFYGVGGMKIFRDLIYTMQGLMKADHLFYKEHGFYDFPQKNKGRIFTMKLLGMLLRNQKLKSKMGNKISKGMIAPYKKVLNNRKK